MKEEPATEVQTKKKKSYGKNMKIVFRSGEGIDFEYEDYDTGPVSLIP